MQIWYVSRPVKVHGKNVVVLNKTPFSQSFWLTTAFHVSIKIRTKTKKSEIDDCTVIDKIIIDYLDILVNLFIIYIKNFY